MTLNLTDRMTVSGTVRYGTLIVGGDPHRAGVFRANCRKGGGSVRWFEGGGAINF